MRTLVTNLNRRVQKELSRILEELMDYAQYLSNKYNIKEFANLYFTFFTKESKLDVDIEPAIMFVAINCMTDEKSDIVQSLHAKIYLSKEDLLDVLVACNMNFNNTLSCLKLVLLHEIGHVIDNRKYIGLTIDEFRRRGENSKVGKVSKLRINASLDNVINYTLEYNNLIESERLANEAVGITDDDIVKFVKMTSGK